MLRELTIKMCNIQCWGIFQGLQPSISTPDVKCPGKFQRYSLRTEMGPEDPQGGLIPEKSLFISMPVTPTIHCKGILNSKRTAPMKTGTGKKPFLNAIQTSNFQDWKYAVTLKVSEQK